jgi:hypothetical protein
MMAKYILDVVGLLFLFAFGVQVLATLRAYGSLPARAVLITIRTSLRSSKLFILLASIAVLFGSIFQPIMSSWIPPLPPLLEVGGALIGLNIACLPPTVLYLASSTPEGILLGNDLLGTVAPLKLINFLESFHSEAPLAERENIRPSSYRVSGNWEKTVMDFCEFVPLIIVDTRVMTAPVIAEINHILNSGLEQRTFFVAGQHGVEPALLYIGMLLKRKIQISTPSELVFALRRIGFKTLVSGQQNLPQSVRKKLEARGAILIR